MKRYIPHPRAASAKLKNPLLRKRKQLKMTQNHDRQRHYPQWPLPGEEEIT